MLFNCEFCSKFMLVNCEHELKALLPIDVTVLGISILDIFVEENALLPIEVTPSGIITLDI